MKKLMVGMSAVCLLSVVAAAQLAGNSYVSSTNTTALADTVSQTAVKEEFEQLVLKYPAQMGAIRQVALVHEDLSELFAQGFNGSFDSFFYQAALLKMEDLSVAVLNIQEEDVKYDCLRVLDHRYHFAPLGEKPSSLRHIANYVARKIDSLTSGFAQPRWGNFYEALAGHDK